MRLSQSFIHRDLPHRLLLPAHFAPLCLFPQPIPPGPPVSGTAALPPCILRRAARFSAGTEAAHDSPIRYLTRRVEARRGRRAWTAHKGNLADLVSSPSGKQTAISTAPVFQRNWSSRKHQIALKVCGEGGRTKPTATHGALWFFARAPKRLDLHRHFEQTIVSKPRCQKVSLTLSPAQSEAPQPPRRQNETRPAGFMTKCHHVYSFVSTCSHVTDGCIDFLFSPGCKVHWTRLLFFLVCSLTARVITSLFSQRNMKWE